MNLFYMALVYLVWFLSTYYIVFFLLVLFSQKERLRERPEPLGRTPAVSIIVPAFNEEGKIARTIRSLQRVTYAKLEFIVINDGSRDGTAAEVRAAIKGDRRFRFIDRRENRGKAASLNEGIAVAHGEFVACMDADSVIERRMFEKVLPYFLDEAVGAVTVTVELEPPKRLLHRIIDLEFIIGLSLFLKVFSLFNCVFVTPGPFSIYRKQMLDAIGGFDVENITEDLEVAYRIHKAGYQIENCLDAKVKTIAPKTFRGIYVQRRRWYSGAIQTLVKHRDVLFRRRYGIFSFFVPFNYLLLGGGLVLFTVSLYLGLSRFIQNVLPMQYTGFSFLHHLDFSIDLLRIGGVSLIGWTAFLTTFAILFIGLTFTQKRYREKKLGIITYPLLFFLYQIFWAGAILAVIRGKKVKWR